MTMSLHRIAGVLALACGLAVIMAGGASAATSALGADGAVLRVVSGSYGELFPDGVATAADSQVLALEIRTADGVNELRLVPETASPAAESLPALVYESATDTAYLVWQSKIGVVHSVLQLTSYHGGNWGPVFEITGNSFTRKIDPQLRVVRDRHADPAEPGRTVERTAIHLAWGEESAGGTVKRWTPIVIEDGKHLSWMPTWNLNDLLGAGDAEAMVDPHAALRLQAGWKDNSVVVGFLSTWGEHLGVVELELLPAELAALAEDHRYQLVPNGARFEGYDQMAAALHAFIIEHGEGFHPASLNHIADAAAQAVVNTGLPWGAEGQQLATEAARYQIITNGAVFGMNGMADENPFTILEIDRPDDPESHHLLKATVRSLRPAPTGIGEDPALYLSEHGTDVIVAWRSEDAVHYVESIEDGWSEPRSILLGDSLDAADVERMLEARVASR